MSDIHDAGIPACPSCGQVDQVRGVPAVYHAGIDTVAVRVPASGDEPEHTERRTVTSTLARALAPAPATGRYGWGCLGAPLLLAGVGGYVVAAGAGHWRAGRIVGQNCVSDEAGDNCTQVYEAPSYLPHGAYSGLGWIAVSVFAVGLGLVVSAILLARAYRRRLAVGRERAETVWSRGWYCARCGTVHFRPATDVPPGAVRLGEFRRIVWSAGGYGDLVARHPVV